MPARNDFRPIGMPNGQIEPIAGDADLGLDAEAGLAKARRHLALEIAVGFAAEIVGRQPAALFHIGEVAFQHMHALSAGLARVDVGGAERGEQADALAGTVNRTLRRR